VHDLTGVHTVRATLHVIQREGFTSGPAKVTPHVEYKLVDASLVEP
jgi:hypothetical protein